MTHARDARCPMCGGADARLRYRITRFEVLDCRACTLVYLWPQPSPEEIRAMFATLYTTGEGSVPELRDYYGYCYEDAPGNPLVQLYERWLDALERVRAPGRLLDIGCGTGLFLAVARRRGWQPFGIDDCVEATQHAREHFKLDVWGGDFGDFAAQGHRFEAITGWDIIEHSRDPVELLGAMRRCLAPGGVVGLSTPNQRSILDAGGGPALPRERGSHHRAAREVLHRAALPLPHARDAQHRRSAGPGSPSSELRRELTDLSRLTLSPATRLGLQALFGVARLTGLENRIFAVARAANGAQMG